MSLAWEQTAGITGAPVPIKFPCTRHSSAGAYFGEYAKELARAGETIDPYAMDRAAAILTKAYTGGCRVFSCGNGGSASIANHAQCDHAKGVSTGTDLAPRVVSLSANIELVTAIANDIEYANVFTFQLRLQADPGDVLIAVSSSGRSPNVVKALAWARDHGMRTIAVTGFEGGEARKLAEVAIHVDCANYGIIEDLHQAVMHALAQYVRQSRMTPDMIAEMVF